MYNISAINKEMQKAERSRFESMRKHMRLGGEKRSTFGLGKRILAGCMAGVLSVLMAAQGLPAYVKAEETMINGVQASTERSVMNFNTDWRYHRGDVTGAQEEVYQDEAWGYVNLPHSTTFYTPDNKDAYLGISWYRKRFTLSDDLKGKKLMLTFEAAMQKADVWINGEHVTQHKGGYTPFVLDLEGKVKFGQENVIAVKIDSRPDSDFAPGKTNPDFQYFGGIYGNAYITVTDPIHISDAVEADVTAGGGIFITTPKVSEGSAQVKVKTHIENDSNQTEEVTLVTEILDPDGEVVASGTDSMEIGAEAAEEYIQTITVEEPRLWSPDTPELYTTRSTVKTGEVERDSCDTTFGIRTVEWKREGLFVNGEKMDEAGANLHGETYMFGNAVPDNAIYEEVKRFKEYGFDIMRMAHYPHRKAFYDACDKYGVMVLDCISGWQYASEDEAFKESTYEELRTNIRNHRNHPSIVAWETSLNESGYTRNWAVEMNKIAKEEYPQDGSAYAYTAGCYHWDVWDIGLGTPQAGMFEKGSESAEGPDNLNKPIIIAEHGDWNYGGSGSSSRVTREAVNSYGVKGGDEGMLIQADNIQESEQLNRSRGKDWLGAEMYWDFADYAGFDNRLIYCGVVDLYRLPKYGAYFYQSQRPADVDLSDYGLESGPMVFIANAWDEKADTEVRIYTNCDTVELFLNGKSLGEKGHDETIWSPHGDGSLVNFPDPDLAKEIPADSLENPPITFRLDAYEPGELKAVAKIDGVERATYIRRTPKAASGIQLRPESEEPLPLDGSSAKLVWIDVTDSQGTVVTSDYSDISLEVEGPGFVVGPKTIAARGGQVGVWVKSKRGAGEITLTATSEGLESASVTIPTKEVEGLPPVPEGGDADEYEAQKNQPENIFLGKSASASTENENGATGAETAPKANDGDSNSKWCASDGTYPQWWEVDLGAEYRLDTMKLSFETEGSTYYYTVAVSGDPMTEETYQEHLVADYSQGSADTELTLEGVKGRYVRITFTEASNEEWAVLREVSGTGESDNIALNKPVTASSVNQSWQGLEKAEYANDGNRNTKWCASGGEGTFGHWWQVDLKDTYRLSHVKMQMEFPDAAYRFVLQGSTDGKNYKTIQDFRNTQGCGQTIQVETDTIVQYLRVYDITTQDMNSQWPAIVEFEAYGEKTDYRLSSVTREKEAFASSSKEDSDPSYGSNGVPGWYWYPDSLGDEWWYIDTKGIYELDNIQMTWNGAEEHRYLIDISTDGINWITVVDRGKEGTDDLRPYEAVEGTARYIRVRLPGERITDQGFGLLDAYAPAPTQRRIEEVEAVRALKVPQGTPFSKLPLPTELQVKLEGGISTSLLVEWEGKNYHATKAGTQKISGALKSIDGITLEGSPAVSAEITVEEQRRSANYSAVDAALARAEGLKESEYTPESWKVLQDAIQAVVWGKDSSHQAQVDAMAKSITNAILNLRRKEAQGQSEKPSAKTLASPTIRSLKAKAYKKGVYVTVTVNQVEGAEQYEIYRKDGKEEKKIGVTGRGKNVFLDKNPKNRKAQYYAVAISGDQSVRSEAGKKKTIRLAPSVKVKRASSVSGGIRVAWKKIKGARKYMIYRSTKKNTGYVKVKTLKKARDTYVDRKARKGKQYYYKVVAYNGKQPGLMSKPSNRVKR